MTEKNGKSLRLGAAIAIFFKGLAKHSVLKIGRFDRILVTQNKPLLTAIETIFDSTETDEKLALNSKQIEMMMMSERNIEQDDLISEAELKKSDTEWINQRNFGITGKSRKKTDGFLLPTELQWYQYKKGEIGEPRGNARTFTNVSVSEEEMGDEFYAMPEGVKVDNARGN